MEIHVYGSINIAHANSLYRRKSRGLFTRYAFKREGGEGKTTAITRPESSMIIVVIRGLIEIRSRNTSNRFSPP